MEDEYEQLSSKLRSTNEKLEETLKAADECEKYIVSFSEILSTLICPEISQLFWHHQGHSHKKI